MSNSTQWPTEGSLSERADRTASLLMELIPLADGASEIKAARHHLEELRGKPELLTTIVDSLQLSGAFDLLPVLIQETLQHEPIRQTDTTGDGLIHTVSTVRIRASTQAVATAIFDHEWSWWNHGRVLDWQHDNTVRFILKPISTQSFGYLSLPATVGLELAPAEETEECTRSGEYSRKKLVYPTKFTGDFDGPGRYEIVDLADGCLLRSIWGGVRRKALRVKMLPMRLFLFVHLGGEKGSLSWPLPKHTGFPGLIKYLTTESA